MARHPKWVFLECSARLNWNVGKVFEKVGAMVRDCEKEKEKTAQTSKMKIHPSKLRKTSDNSSCC